MQIDSERRELTAYRMRRKSAHMQVCAERKAEQSGDKGDITITYTSTQSQYSRYLQICLATSVVPVQTHQYDENSKM